MKESEYKFFGVSFWEDQIRILDEFAKPILVWPNDGEIRQVIQDDFMLSIDKEEESVTIMMVNK